MDNGSTDGTLEILAALKQEGLNITVFQNRAVTFNESDAITYLYNIAVKEHSPDWIICLDADEFIDDRKIPGGIKGYLFNLSEASPDIDCIKIPMINYIATSFDNKNEVIVPLRMARRQEPSDVYKVIVSGKFLEGEISIQHGSHWVSLRDRQVKEVFNNNLLLAHYPERSPYQYLAKFIRGWSKVLATGQKEIDRKTAYHYQGVYGYLRDNPQSLLRNPRFMGFKDENDLLINDQIDYQGGSLRYTEPSDEAMRAVRSLMGFFQDLAISHGKILDNVLAAREWIDKTESEVTRLF
jgi:glycosyltransferase involved in cell wall biosynthesis